MGRFVPSGVSAVVFVTSTPTLSGPTQAQITAGTKLTDPSLSQQAESMKQMDGWEAASQSAPVPDVSSKFDKTVPGRQSAGTPTITMYLDDSSVVIRTALAEGTNGYILIMAGGQAATKLVDIYPVRVASSNDSQINSENEAMTYVVGFDITAAPTRRVAQAA